MTVTRFPTYFLPSVGLTSFLERCRDQQAKQLEVLLAVLPASPSPEETGPIDNVYCRKSSVFTRYAAKDVAMVGWNDLTVAGTLTYEITDRVCRVPVEGQLALYPPLVELQKLAEAHARGCAQRYQRLLQTAELSFAFSVETAFLYLDNEERVPFGEPITSKAFTTRQPGVIALPYAFV